MSYRRSRQPPRLAYSSLLSSFISGLYRNSTYLSKWPGITNHRMSTCHSPLASYATAFPAAEQAAYLDSDIRRAEEDASESLLVPDPQSLCFTASNLGLGDDTLEESSSLAQVSQTTAQTNGYGDVLPVNTELPGNSAAQDAVATTAPKRGKRKDLTCDQAGCDYQRTFRGQWELQRHKKNKHTDRKPFWCPVVRCNKGGQTPSFFRSDKLTDHIRKAHRGQDATVICPDVGCATIGLELDLLSVHVRLDTNTSKGSTFKRIDPMFSRFSQSQSQTRVSNQLDLFWPARRPSCLTRAVCPVEWLVCLLVQR